MYKYIIEYLFQPLLGRFVQHLTLGMWVNLHIVDELVDVVIELILTLTFFQFWVF